MPRRFDPKIVGAFVIAAVALGVVVAIYLGAGRIFQHRVRFVVVFSEDLAGLDVHSQVEFRGVPVGRVVSIHIAQPPAERLSDVRMPVVIEINQTRVEKMGGEVNLADERVMRKAVEQGLRASLALESLLSNRRYVALDILPDAPPPRPSPVPLPFPEIPVYQRPGLDALQADAAALLTKLRGIDFEGFVADLRRAATSLERAAGGVDAATTEMSGTLRAAEAAMASVGSAARALEAGVTPLATDTRAAVVQLRTTLETAEAAIRHADELVDPGSPFAWQLSKTLGEVERASRAVRHLADGIERDPGALLRGRAESRR